MKKSTLAIICAGAGICAGALLLLLIFALTGVFSARNASPTREVTEVSVNADERELINAALDIAGDMKRGDFKAIAAQVHPEYGVYFSPTATVSLSSNKCFTADEVRQFGGSKTSYVWGGEQDIGSPIEMTPDAYFIKYVFDKDYTNASVIGVDRVLKSGNALDNVQEVFAGARFIDLLFPGTRENDYTDWSVLRLVFEEYSGRYMLTAIIHSEESL